MAIFNWLPDVDACCCCIELKWGCVLIIIFSLLGFGTTSTSLYLSPCREESSIYQTITDVAAFIVFAANLYLVIASIIFIFGIIKGIPSTATWFMYGVLFLILGYLIYFTVSIVFYFLHPKCKDYVNLSGPIPFILIYLYFLIVVKSYREVM